MDTLIHRVRQHIAQSEEGEEVFLPASEALVEQAETELGFALPKLLREMYLQIGNGGFGPGYGIVGLTGGALEDGRSIVELYQSNRQTDPTDPLWAWPEHLLQFCHWGCGIYSCLDSSNVSAPVVVFDPNKNEYDEGGLPQSWDTCFFIHKPSFSAWVEAWIDDEDLWTGTSRRTT